MNMNEKTENIKTMHKARNVDHLMQTINLQSTTSNNDSTQSTATTTANNSEIPTNILHKILSSKADVTIPCIPHRPTQHNRRKSSHQGIRANPDIQFETIILEHNEDSSDEEISTEESAEEQISSNVMLENEESFEQVFNAGFVEFLNSDETLNIIKEIAAERLRINMLLTLNGMPEINFPLYAPAESLRMELGERFRALDKKSGHESG